MSNASQQIVNKAWNFAHALCDDGLVESDTSHAPLRFGLPLEALAYYFPRLYPEVAV